MDSHQEGEGRSVGGDEDRGERDAEVSGSTSKIETNKHKQQKTFSTVTDVVRHLVTTLSE